MAYRKRKSKSRSRKGKSKKGKKRSSKKLYVTASRGGIRL